MYPISLKARVCEHGAWDLQVPIGSAARSKVGEPTDLFMNDERGPKQLAGLAWGRLLLLAARVKGQCLATVDFAWRCGTWKNQSWIHLN